MKEAIEKAIENGFDIKQLTSYTYTGKLKLLTAEVHYHEISFTFEDAECHWHEGFCLYRFIFGTDFIDRLVGENPLCRKCGLRPEICPTDGKMKCGKITADYHREKLANMTKEQMVEYVRRLV